jgi:ATP synthase protein I
MEDHDVRIVRGAILATALVTPVAAAAGWLAADGAGALGAAIGMALAAAFFSVTLVVVRAAERISPDLILPATLASYVIKMTVLGIGLFLLRDTTAFNRTAFALAVLAGTVVFLAAEMRFALRARIPSVSTPQDDG